jgi:hypothetical protein
MFALVSWAAFIAVTIALVVASSIRARHSAMSRRKNNVALYLGLALVCIELQGALEAARDLGLISMQASARGTAMWVLRILGALMLIEGFSEVVRQ